MCQEFSPSAVAGREESTKSERNLLKVGGRQSVRRQGSGKDVYASWVAEAFEA